MKYISGIGQQVYSYSFMGVIYILSNMQHIITRFCAAIYLHASLSLSYV